MMVWGVLLVLFGLEVDIEVLGSVVDGEEVW